MANRYWVGGTANWNLSATANWSATSGGAGGASVPTASDSVFFDQAGTYTVTTSNALTCLDITVSAGTYTITGIGSLDISGSMSLIAGTVWSSTGTITFNATTTGKTITTNGTVFGCAMTFNGVGGEWTLGSSLTIGPTFNTTLTAGALILNGFDLTTGSFNSTNTNTRSIAFGSNNIVLNHSTAATAVLVIGTYTGFTWTGTGGFTTNADVTRTITTTGASATTSVNLSLTGSGTSIITFTSGSWFNILNFGTTAFAVPTATVAVNNITLSSSGTYTALTIQASGTGTVTTTGKTIAAFVVTCPTGTSTLGGALTTVDTGTTTLTQGTLDLAGFTLTTGIFSSTNTNTRSITFGSSNIVLAHTSAAQTVLSMAIATGFTWTGTGGFTADASVTRTFTFGTTGGSATNAPNLTLTGSGVAIPTLTTASWFNKLDFGTTAFTLAATNLNLNSLTLSTGGTFTNLTASMVGAGTITANGKSIGPLVINNSAGTTTLAGALGCTTYTQTAGTINFATFNLTCSSTASYTAGTLNNIGTISCTTWTCSGTFTMSQGTFTPSTSFIVTGGFNYNGGTITTNTFTHTSGTVTLGATFTLPATCTYTLTAGTLSLNGYNLTTGAFASTNANARSISFGTNNIILAHTTAATTVLSMANATSFTYTGTGGFTADASVTRTFTFGTTAGSTTNSPNLTLTGSGTAIATITTASWFNKLDFGTTAFAIAATNLNLNSLTLSTGGTFTNLTASMRATGTIVTNGNTTLGPLVINNGAGTTTLTSALTCTTYTQTSGDVNFATFNLTCSASATYTAGTYTNTGTITCTTWTCAGTFTMTNGTITPSTGFVVTGGFNYNGGTLSPVPTFTQTSGTVTLGKAYATTATGSYTLSAGTLNLNGFNLTTGAFLSSNTGTRSIAFGSNNIILSNTTAGAANLNMAGATGFTWTGTGGFVSDASITRTFTFGSSAGATSTNAPNLTWTGSGTAVQTLTTASYFNTLNFGTTAFNPGTTTLNLNSLILSSGGTFTGLTPSMVGTGSITSNGKTVAALTINSTSGTTTFVDQLSLATATAATTLTSGTLDLSGFDLTTGYFLSTNTNTRSIIFGSKNIILANSTALATNLDMTNATGFTWTGTGGFTADASITRTFVFGTTGGSSTNAPNLTLTGSGTAILTFTTGSWFNNLNFGTTAFAVPTTALNISTLTLSSGGTFTALQPILTRTQTWTAQYSKTLAGLGFDLVGGTLTLDNTQTYTATSVFTLTSGTLNLGGYNLTIGTFSSTNTNTRSIVFGSNNIVLSTTTVGAINLAMSNATGFTYTGTGGFTAAADITRTFTFGTTAGGTSANSPNLTLTGSGTAVQTFTTTSTFNKLDFGTTAFNPGATSLSVNSLTLSSGGTFTGLTPTMFGTGTIIANGKTLAALTVNCPSGTTTLSGALATGVTATTTLTAGTLDLAGFTLTTGIFSSTNTTTRAIAFGSGNISLVNTTVAQTVLYIADATNFTQSGTGGFTSDASVTRTYTFGTTGSNATNAPNLTLTGSGTAIATFTTGSWFNNLNFGTTAFAIPVTTLNIGTLTLSSGGTFTSLIPIFTRTQTWTAQFSKQLNGIGVNGSGVTLTLDNTQTYTATSQCVLTQGTLNLGGYDLTIGTISSSNTNTRSIAFGTNNIVLSTTTAAAVNISIADATNFTYTGTGGFTAAADITRTFTFGTTAGATSTNSPNLTLTGSGTAIATITSGGSFNKLDFGTTAFAIAATTLYLNSLTLSTGGTFTALNIIANGTGTITSNGKTIGSFNINHSGTTTLGGALTTGATSPTTLTAGTLSLNGFDLTTGTFASTNTNVRSIIFGSKNIILATSTAGTTNLSMATVTGFTWTGTGGFTADASITRIFVFGTTGGSSTNAPNLTLTGSGTAIATITTGSWFNKLDFGTTAFALPTTSLNLESFTLSSAGTYTGLTATMVDTGTITPNGKSIAAFTINHSGTTTLAGPLGCTTYTQTAGTIDFATFDLTCSSTATYTAGTLTNTGTITCTTWTCAGTFTMTNGTITPSTGFVVTGGFNYNGGTLSAVPTFTHTSGTVTLGKAYALTATGTYTLTAGTLDLGGFILTSGLFSSTNTNTRSISFGSGNIVLATTTAAAVNLNMANATSFTYTGTGGFTADASITRTFTFGTTGGSTTNSPNLTLTGSGTAIATLTTGSWFNKLDFGTTAFTIAATTLNLESLTLSITGTYTSLTANMVGAGIIIPNSKTILALTINHSGTTQVGIPYKVYSWTSSGSMTTPASNSPPLIDYLVVAGGGSGVGECSTNAIPGAGGGGGGIVYQTGYSTYVGTSTITVGAGAPKTVFGSASTAVGGTGADSSISTLVVAKGGGGGGSYQAGNAGGSGGGGGNSGGAVFAAGATNQVSSGVNPIGSVPFGSIGGTVVTSALSRGGAGGGGATSAGSNSSATTGANGGSGLTSSFSGTLTGYGGGGGGGGSYTNGGSGGSGQDGGGNGGNGQSPAGSGGSNATSGSANTGGGGGSAANYLIAGNGGSGIVMIRYPASYADLITTGSPTISTGTDTLLVSGTTTLTSGQLDLVYSTLSTGIFSSSNTNTRSINFGSNIITLTTSTAASTVLNMDDATNFTYTGTPLFTTAMSVTRTFSFGSTAGGSASNAPSLSLTSGASIPTITSGSWFKTLDFTGTTSTPATTIINVDTLTLATGGTYTGVTPIFTRTQTWTAQFSKQLNGIGVNGSGVTLTLDNTQTYTATSTCYLTQGTINLGGSNQTFGAFDSNNTNTRALTFGSNNIILATTTADTTVINAPDITNFSYTGTGGFVSNTSVTRTFTYGSTAGGSASNAVNLSLTSGASTASITSGSWFKSLDFTGTTSTLTGIINVDTLTLATGGTYIGLTPIFTRTQTWTAQFSKILAGIGVNKEGVTLTLDSTQIYIAPANLYVRAGTLNLNSTNFVFNNLISDTTSTRAITGGGSISINYDWTVTNGTNFTGSNYTIYMASQLPKTFAGGGGSYGTLVQQTASALTITGSNTFANVQINSNMTTVVGQQEYTTPGTYSWTAPTNVYSVSVVAVGAGGGGYSSGINTTAGQGGAGGGLGWKNNIPVTPGVSYTVVVGQGYRCTVVDSTKANDGGPSYFIDLSTVAGLGGQSADGTSTNFPLGGGYIGDGGGNGGNGSVASNRLTKGAGGAGGYSGNGGDGGVTGVAGSGGGGGGSSEVSCASGTSGSASGGGVGIYGQGSNGTAGTGIIGGGGGSSGVGGGGGVSNGTNDAACSATMGTRSGGAYGGGGGAFSGNATPANSAAGGGGAVRIIWGSGRAFPSTNTTDM